MRFWNIPTIVVFWLLLTIFFARFFMLHQAVYGDGIYYWAYMRSAIIDNDLDLRNEASHSYSPEGNNQRIDVNQQNTDSLITNKYYPIGSSLMWSPAFAIAHSLSKPLSLPDTGYADHYQIAVGVLNVSFILIGLVLIYQLLIKKYSSLISSLTIILILFATNLIYYGSIDVLNSHPSSFLISSIILTLLFKLKQSTSSRLLFLSGLTLGLLALIRPQDALFGVLFVPFFFQKDYVPELKRILIFISGAFIAYLPQLLTSYNLFGNFLLLPYLTGTQTFSPTDPHILELFISPTQGLLYYCPIYLVGIGGLVVYAKNKKMYWKRFLILFLLELFLISIWSGWSQGEAFGLRMMIALLPIFGLGIAEILLILSTKLSKVAIVLIVCLFIIQNFLMIISFHLFLHESTFIEGELTQGGKLRREILEIIKP